MFPAVANFQATDPTTGDANGSFVGATPSDVELAARQAAAATLDPRLGDDSRRARFLRGAATALRERGKAIVEVAIGETGLPRARLDGELERTAGQLEGFALLLEEGDYVDAYIDPPDPEARPIPRPDIRRMLIPLGPVAVFGASNFPLAFSVAGGDTAAAIAAGCPVVVKGHPAHPGTGELAAAALDAAAARAEMPAGSFHFLPSPGRRVGEELVRRPEIAAVAFTGSAAAGMALVRLAAERPRPIPVFAEMGSVNPLVVSAGAAAARGEEIGGGLLTAIAGSAGQLCTKPGLIFLPSGANGEAIAAAVAAGVAGIEDQVMLTAGIRDALAARIGVLDRLASPLGDRETVPDGPGARIRPCVYATDAMTLSTREELREECFGPVAIFVTYANSGDLCTALAALGGQLTASIHLEPDESELARDLLPTLMSISGRVIFNGYPTGVSVTHAMHHGGPFPATSNPAHTSVGMTAIFRFLRPIAFQDAPPRLLHDVLRDDNPRGIWRRVDGSLTREPFTT
jgi:acyl-CoA reductase-like NAD-dependent aldehyde dehydrogenase